MTHKDHKEGMEERFQMLKEKLIAVEQNEWWLSDEDFILAFIREELSHQLTTIQEMVEGMKVKVTECSKDCGLCGRGLQRKCQSYEYLTSVNDFADDLLAKLKEIKQ